MYNVFHWDPKIFSAISPVYMYRFVRKINKASWKSLNSILLCVAGWLACSSFYTNFLFFVAEHVDFGSAKLC